MWSALASIILGAVGWVLARLVFEPMKEIFDLRREVQECLIIHGNLGKEAPAEERRAASDAFRSIGAGLVSRHVAAYPWARWCCARLGWEIHGAGALLISLGNSTQFEGFTLANLAPTVVHIRNCLKLPTPQKPPIVQALVEHAGQPASSEPQDANLIG
jgi:hypothetical protein